MEERRGSVIEECVGDGVFTYAMTCGSVRALFTNRGATLMSLFVPDREGKVGDIVLGFDTVGPYMDAASNYIGCIVGRVANRIACGAMELDGERYCLPINNGPNTLHGGKETETSGTAKFAQMLAQADFAIYKRPTGKVYVCVRLYGCGGEVGYNKVLWKSREVKDREGPSVQFTYRSFDGEQGFPGDLDVSVTYTLTEASELRTEMEAKPVNKATPISLAQHSYFNLAGHDQGSILDHMVHIWGSSITPVNQNQIPTGEVTPVHGTPFDFTTDRSIGSRIGEVLGGYDHNYVLHDSESEDDYSDRKAKDGLQLAARVWEPVSMRMMEVFTTAPGIQFYSGNFLDGVVGKGGAVYNKHSGLCLETQGFPNAVNEPKFPSVIVRPGETYRHVMVHRFSTIK